MLIETLSTDFGKALQQSNSLAATFASIFPSATAPTVQPGGLSIDGVVQWGFGGDNAPNRVLLVPYCEGGLGAQFSVRLYGWKLFAVPTGDPTLLSWIPFFICELLCTSCNAGGPAAEGASGPSARTIKDSERLCDTISLTQGDIGFTGRINSTGPGTDLVAYAWVETLGARFLQFDFAAVDQVSMPVTMNSFWARA